MNRRNFIATAAATIFGVFLTNRARSSTPLDAFPANWKEIPVEAITFSTNPKTGSILLIVTCNRMHVGTSTHYCSRVLRPKKLSDLIKLSNTNDGYDFFYTEHQGNWYGFIDRTNEFRDSGFAVAI